VWENENFPTSFFGKNAVISGFLGQSEAAAEEGNEKNSKKVLTKG